MAKIDKWIVDRKYTVCKGIQYIMNKQMGQQNNIKGYEYELQILDYIKNTLGKEAYLWSHTPEDILIKYGIISSHDTHRLIRKNNIENPLPDTGIDIVQIDETGLSFVQCKNGYNDGINYGHLAGFWHWMLKLESKKIHGYVYYTNKLSPHIDNPSVNTRVHYIKHPYIDNNINSIGLVKTIQKNGFVVNQEKLVYQTEATNLIVKNFETNKRGILWGICGIGKTYICYLVSQHYDQVIIVSPLKEFARQNMDKFIEYGVQRNMMLVSSDGERNMETVNNFIKKNKQFIISVTYDSMDVIKSCINKMNNPLMIVDEFHNITKNNVINKDDDFNKILNSDKKMLFVSATPRIYEMEDSEDYDQNMFGPIVFKMTFNEAILKGYITDYRIWLPSVSEKNDKLKQDLSIYKIDDEIKCKCMFLFAGLLNKGSRKCIVYCADINEIIIMRKAMELLNDFYKLDIHTDQITSKNNPFERSNSLKKFAESKKISLLYSARILDECIDIPSCDSIFITYQSQSKIRTIQRLCRSIRIDKNNKNKVGNIFLWCDEYDKILVTLSGLKEYDEMFAKKVGINVNNFYDDNKVVLDKINDDIKKVTEYVVGIKEYVNFTLDSGTEALFKYIREHGVMPNKCASEYTVRRIYTWFDNVKQKQMPNKESNAYKTLSQNEIVADKLNQFMDDREKNKNKINLTQDEWDDLVVNFCTEHNRLPINNDTDYEGENIGARFKREKANHFDVNHRLYKKIIKIGVGDNTYDKLRSELNECLVKKTQPKKKLFTREQSLRHYRDFCNNEMKSTKQKPSQTETHNDCPIGSWYIERKKELLNKNDSIYKMLTMNGNTEYDFIVKDLDKTLAVKQKNLGKTKNIPISEDQWIGLLFDYCNTNVAVPRGKFKHGNDIVGTREVGDWFQHIIAGITRESLLYKKMEINKYVKIRLDEYIDKHNGDKNGN